ncbi:MULTISPECIES: phage major tail tube protein [Ilyobacter]|jgi:phage tail tube protein FII|uniref:Major tail tube protein n=1 Tax=Ilyobacter polytropus (strain ATCC 51220 / DSM 2926 / LMG 16218 / CuHBu1) TaxID=572544 RepID=E3H9B4_ILYPC|nr:phage major tail tube protein [Ilyobacter polytropus]ADO82813.1 major tail tube protein [Ilyobacter polytropus DSM 2926]
MLGGIPTSLQGFSLYIDALKEVGTVDLELPNIQFMTDTLSGSGIAGEIEVPVPGLTQSMTLKIKKRAVNQQFTTLLAPRNHLLTFRGNMNMADPEHPVKKSKNRKIRVVANVTPKSMNIGKAEVAKSMDTEAEFEVASIIVFVDEVPNLHIDKFNNKFVVDGVNYLDDDNFL